MLDRTQLVQKICVVFGKTGPSIYHSHHDMIRFWERAVKRAELPVRLTQGFNPRPRIIFPHALGVGIASRCEEVELELFAHADTTEVKDRMARACGDTVDIFVVGELPPVKKSRQLTLTSYRIDGWPDAAADRLPAAVADILARTEIIVERGMPGDRRRVDIRPYVRTLAYDAAANALLLELAHSQAGSGRPDEVAGLAAELVGADRHDLRIEKTAMTLV